MFVLTIMLTYGIWLSVRCLLLDYFTIPSLSMEPTLQLGDKVVVNKMLIGARLYKDLHFYPNGQELKSWRLKGIRELRHNDIVVFNFPHHKDIISFVINNVYCKRVVGMPGDSLSIVNGHYHNNNYKGILGDEKMQSQLEQTPDSMVYQPALAAFPYSWRFAWTIRNFGPMYIPRKGDIININPYEATLYKMILAWETGKPIECDWESNTVWAGDKRIYHHQWQHNYYFMAGDNVINSYDSRYWGLVPEEYVVGVVNHIIKKEKGEI